MNTTFVTADCKSKCVCTHDAYLACIPLCPKAILKCPVGFTLQIANQTIMNIKQTCSCPIHKCVPIGSGEFSSTELKVCGALLGGFLSLGCFSGCFFPVKPKLIYVPFTNLVAVQPVLLSVYKDTSASERHERLCTLAKNGDESRNLL